LTCRGPQGLLVTRSNKRSIIGDGPAGEEAMAMSRRFDDPVQVRRADEAPSEFLWRGRLYVVRGVLAHWVETGAWWQKAAPAAGVLDDEEREVWRVEASRGRAFASGVYDLCFEWSAGTWTLQRAQD
jgi:hypothetical protein